MGDVTVGLEWLAWVSNNNIQLLSQSYMFVSV